MTDIPKFDSEAGEWDFNIPSTPHWACQSCGHEWEAPMPPNREAFYKNPKPKQCPHCKSIDGVPRGF